MAKYQNGNEAAVGDLVIGRGLNLPSVIIGPVLSIDGDTIVVDARIALKESNSNVTAILPSEQESGIAMAFVPLLLPVPLSDLEDPRSETIDPSTPSFHEETEPIPPSTEPQPVPPPPGGGDPNPGNAPAPPGGGQDDNPRDPAE